jgi:molybdopterin/thiamine biosynthesis adenylyltransferase
VAVIGCGAVGSRIAEHLALSGVGELTLVDPEQLTPDNVYRHVLGGDVSGSYKVQALAERLTRRLPEIKVNGDVMTLEEWSNSARPGIDAIVLAIGLPHLERAFVRATRQLEGFTTPIITVWLEALGLGGHVQVSKRDVAGCLECLYTDAFGESSQIPKISYVEGGQTLSRNLTGCVGSFTSFSALDATQTAILATRMTVATLTNTPQPSYQAWKGSDAEARAHDIRTSPWFKDLDDKELAKAAIEYSRVACSVCGGTA